jgi:hypothetical protein
MRLTVIVLLAFFWVFLAVRAYQHGDMALAGIFIAAGAALTIYRLRRAS